MRCSSERILTTHVGSLPRNERLSQLLIAEERGDAVDKATLSAEVRAAVADVVARQVASGIDVINDGEQPRVGFQTYVPQRMRGFGGSSRRPRPLDYIDFPEYAKSVGRRFPHRSKVGDAPMAVSAVAYTDLGPAEAECDAFAEAAASWQGHYAEAFMTAASPGVVATTMLNAWYDSHEAYVFALARELRHEYELIVSRGLILQIDAPDLAMERTMLFQDKPLSEFLAIIEIHVAALNEALAGIPRDRVRLHCCWGNWEGPHTHDVPLADILPVIAKASVGALSLEFANPRHQHEYAELGRFGLPAEMLLLPGVIDSTTNYVEHPEVVAKRIAEAVAAVGDRERVIAGADCGFGTFTGYEFVAADIVWAKLAALSEGAAIASRRLWGR